MVRASRLRAPVLALLLPILAGADESVPVAIQAELLTKVAAYDRNLPKRAGDRVITLILTKAHSTESERTAAAMQNALAAKTTVAGLPHLVERAELSDPASLAGICKAKHVAILYLTPGFEDAEVAAIAAALDGVDVLTVSAVARYLSKGLVLGLDVVSGRPKLHFSIGRSRRQGIAMSATVLALMEVHE
jgi:hypothetical protein